MNVAAVFGFGNGFDFYRTNGKYFRDNLEDKKYWLEKNSQERFFLFFHGYDPHTPYVTDPTDRIALSLPDRPPRHSFRRVCRRDSDRKKRIEPFLAEYDGSIRRGLRRSRSRGQRNVQNQRRRTRTSTGN